MTIWADAGTNALVINAPERVRQDMLAVVNQIDIPRYQVQVDAIIVELSEEKTRTARRHLALGGDNDDEVLGLTNFSNAGGGGSSGSPARRRATRRTSAAIAEGITLGVGKITRLRDELGGAARTRCAATARRTSSRRRTS